MLNLSTCVMCGSRPELKYIYMGLWKQWKTMGFAFNRYSVHNIGLELPLRKAFCQQCHQPSHMHAPSSLRNFFVNSLER